MFHNTNPQAIEGSDIIGLLDSKLERIGERVFAMLHVELNPTKEYADAGHNLHVTDGVNPRLLQPSGEKPSAKKKADVSTLSVEERLARLEELNPLPSVPVVEEDWMKAESMAQEKKAQEERPPSLAPASMDEAMAAEHVRIGSAPAPIVKSATPRDSKAADSKVAAADSKAAAADNKVAAADNKKASQYPEGSALTGNK